MATDVSKDFQPQDLHPESNPHSPSRSTAPSLEDSTRKDTKEVSAVPDDRLAAVRAQRASLDSDLEPVATDPTPRARRVLTRTAAPPPRLQVGTTTTAKTQRRAATQQVAKSIRRSTGARQSRHNNGVPPEDDDDVADIVDTTGGGTARDN